MDSLTDRSDDDALTAWLRREAPMNIERAFEVMVERQLEGLVLSFMRGGRAGWNIVTTAHPASAWNALIAIFRL